MSTFLNSAEFNNFSGIETDEQQLINGEYDDEVNFETYHERRTHAGTGGSSKLRSRP